MNCMKHNAAIYLLSSRKSLLEECLENLYKNWNSKYNYPVYVHYYNDIYSKNFIKRIQNQISKNIYFNKINYKIPSHIKETDLFYNKTNIDYVKKSFTKDRVGYLHMIDFCINITKFGEDRYLAKELSKYDYLMKIDDDSYFKKKIEIDLFEKLKDFTTATAYTWNFVSQRVRDTRIGLWKFYKDYLKKYNYKPKNLYLKNAVENDNEEEMHLLNWSAGNCNLYNLTKFKNNPKWIEYLDEVNKFGGHYKYRWGDIEILDLFFHTHFEKCSYNFNLKEKGIYNNKIPSYLSSYAPGIGQIKKEFFFNEKLIHFLKKIKFKFLNSIPNLIFKISKLSFFYFKLKNFIYQKIKYKKDYNYKPDKIALKLLEKNFYEKSIKKRPDAKFFLTYEEIDFDKLSFDNSISLNDKNNPLVNTSKEIIEKPNIRMEDTTIFDYTKNFKPQNLAEVFFNNKNNLSDKDLKCLNLSPYTIFYPWFHKYPQRFLAPGMFGPKDISFVKFRFLKLKNLINLFGIYGFKPNDNDMICGYKLINDNNDFRFIITAGTHRSAVLKALKYDSIKVKYDDYRVEKDKQIVNILNIKNWPAVKSGYVSENEAREFFKGFFN